MTLTEIAFYTIGVNGCLWLLLSIVANTENLKSFIAFKFVPSIIGIFQLIVFCLWFVDKINI